MTLQEFYKAIGGNYESTLKILKTDERIKKYVKMSIDDENFTICQAMLAQGNIPEAFRASHSLKGICLNLGFSRLLSSASALTENIRDGMLKEDTMDLFEQMKKDYLQLQEAARNLD